MSSNSEAGRFPTYSREASREAFACGGIATVLSVILAWFGPPGSDMAAHAYQRALFLEHGFSLWNNYWYAGHYSFITYSLLYYPLAAVLGIRPLAVLTVTMGAFLFAVVTWREWGSTTRWASRTFAIVWVGILLSGAFPFALGVALALLALAALQVRTQRRFVVLAVLTLAASPLAFALLTLFTVGVAVGKRVDIRSAATPAVALAILGAVELVLWRIFPDSGRYPFSKADLVASSAFSLAGAALLWSIERARTLCMVLVVYGLACVVVFFIPSALGSNITRLQYVALPIAVLVASLRSWRPVPVCVLAFALAATWNIKPLARSISQDAKNVAANQAYWQPAIDYLDLHPNPSYRVEAVDTVGHWPAQFLPAAGIPLARGWFRQDDFPANTLLYHHLSARRYRAWLRALGVRYVLLSSAQPDYSAIREAALLRSGRSGLHVVFRSSNLTVLEVPRPTGIVTGRGAASVVRFSQTRLVLRLARSGRYRLAVRYSPYWHISAGCVFGRQDGLSEVVAPRPGHVVLSFDVDAGRALAAFVGEAGRTCAADPERVPAGR